MENNCIRHVTDYDLKHLKQIIETAKNWPECDMAVLDNLDSLLESAHVNSREEIPPYVVTMNCHVRIADLDEKSDMDFWLAYPDETPLGKDKISVLTPMGMAVLGLKTGDIVEYFAENKRKHLQITRISYQPEANNHYRL